MPSLRSIKVSSCRLLLQIENNTWSGLRSIYWRAGASVSMKQGLASIWGCKSLADVLNTSPENCTNLREIIPVITSSLNIHFVCCHHIYCYRYGGPLMEDCWAVRVHIPTPPLNVNNASLSYEAVAGQTIPPFGSSNSFLQKVETDHLLRVLLHLHFLSLLFQA